MVADLEDPSSDEISEALPFHRPSSLEGGLQQPARVQIPDYVLPEIVLLGRSNLIVRRKKLEEGYQVNIHHLTSGQSNDDNYPGSERSSLLN